MKMHKFQSIGKIFNSGKISRDKNIISRGLCFQGGQTTTDCKGRVVIGLLQIWDLTGYESGKFEYQATSINFPQKTQSTHIIIQ